VDAILLTRTTLPQFQQRQRKQDKQKKRERERVLDRYRKNVERLESNRQIEIKKDKIDTTKQNFRDSRQ